VTSDARGKRRPTKRSNHHLSLVSVYRLPKCAPRLLYQLLAEREPNVNISHSAMPSWRQHCKFVARRPYAAWYLIRAHDDYVGAIYLTAMNEIGVGILAQWRGQGLGPHAVGLLMRKHGRRRYLANINPRNLKSIHMFERMGFHLIQQSYELRG
jgi:RimJ/RimL family protein N-acetyltransferase